MRLELELFVHEDKKRSSFLRMPFFGAPNVSHECHQGLILPTISSRRQSNRADETHSTHELDLFAYALLVADEAANSLVP